MSKLILITGVTGFIGSHLLKGVIEQRYDVRCLVRKTSNISFLDKFENVELIYGDIFDAKTVRQAIRGVDAVFHLVGGGNVSTATEKGFNNLWRLNVLALQNVLEAANNESVEKIVHFSSISAMGVQRNVLLTEESECKPKIPHEVVKYESERLAAHYFEKHSTPIIILRPSQVYGPGDAKSEIPRMLRLVKHGLFPLIDGGEAYMPWVYVSDVIQGAIKALQKGKPGKVYIISDSRSYQLKEIAQTMARFLGAKSCGFYVPRSVAKMVATVMEHTYKSLGKEPPFTRHRVRSTTSNRYVSIKKAQHELLYNPEVPLETGMEATVNWCAKNGYIRV